MSGAAAISAAKNRRSKEINQKPISQAQQKRTNSCSSSSGSCSPQKPNNIALKVTETVNKNKDSLAMSMSMPVTDNLQITGPMHPVKILQLHEQRLNLFDSRITTLSSVLDKCSGMTMQTEPDADESSSCLDEIFMRVDSLESKLTMLEDVIMNIQNKLTVVQNFTIETNLIVAKTQQDLAAQQVLNQELSSQLAALTVNVQNATDTASPDTASPDTASPVFELDS